MPSQRCQCAHEAAHLHKRPLCFVVLVPNGTVLGQCNGALSVGVSGELEVVWDLRLESGVLGVSKVVELHNALFQSARTRLHDDVLLRRCSATADTAPLPMLAFV